VERLANFEVVDSSQKKKILFVCTQNKFRSLTAEHLFSNRTDLEVRSAGVASDARVTLSSELLEWADEVYVFERRHRNIIHKKFPKQYESKSVVCLYVPDEFEYMSSELIIILTEKLQRYLGKPDFESRVN
jgi:predicted protein tyrosine phosphatase